MITPPHRDFAIVDQSGLPSNVMQGWIESVTALLNALGIQEGTGSPEGVVTANAKKLYFRTDGSPGTYLYFKTTDNSDTGWVAIG